MAVMAILLICCSIFSVSAAYTIPKPTNNFFVNDFANVIDASDEQKMMAAGVALYKACDAQVVVVTIPSLEGNAIEDVSLRLAREWGIGDKDKDNGILLLLSVAEPRVRIEVGRGLEGAIPDSKAGRILDTFMIPNYQPGKFTVGLSDTYNSLVNEVYVEYGLTPQDGYIPIEGEEEELSFFEILILIVIIIGAILLFIRYPHLFFLFFRSGGRGGGFGGGGGGGFSGGGGGFSGGGASR